MMINRNTGNRKDTEMNTKYKTGVNVKAIFALMIAGGLALNGCAGKGDAGDMKNADIKETEVAQASVHVVTTNYASYDFAKNIVGDKGEVKLLLPPGSESHTYEPTPQDIGDIQDCDTFIYVGGDSDTWVMGVLESVDTSNIKIVTLMDCVDVVAEELVEGMEEGEHDHDHGDGDHDHDDAHHEDGDHDHDDAHHEDGDHDHDEEHHEDGDHDHDEEHHEDADHDHHEHGEIEYDEHVWTSPVNAQKIVAKIAEAIEESDPANKDFYAENAAVYIKKLEELDGKFRDVVDHAVRKTLVFGDRFPFRYLVDQYGLTYYAAFPGCSAETEASAATVKFLIDKVNQDEIPVVFHLELSNKKMAEIISEETGAKIMELHSCHNVSKDEMDAGITYLEIMEHNVEALKEALN